MKTQTRLAESADIRDTSSNKTPPRSGQAAGGMDDYQGVDVDIVPALAPGAQPPPNLHAAWMSRVDGCPEACGNAEPPRDVKATATGYMAAYLCSDCGHAWLTSWKDD